MQGSGDRPQVHGQFDKVRLLASKDVVYGKPQFVMHQVQQDDAGATASWANTPLLSGDKGQHLVVFRARDTRHIGASQQGYGTSGTVMVQDAFDRAGKLRTRPEKDALDAGAAGSVRGYPCAEHDGAVYVYWGRDADALRVADGMRAADGVNVPVKIERPSLSGRLADASNTLVRDQLRRAQQTSSSPSRFDHQPSSPSRFDHSRFDHQHASPLRPHTHSLALADLHLPPLPPAASPARASTGAHGARFDHQDSGTSASSPAARHPVTAERLSLSVARRLGTPSRTLPMVARTLGFERGASEEYREELALEEYREELALEYREELALEEGIARLGTPAGRRTLLSRQVGDAGDLLDVSAPQSTAASDMSAPPSKARLRDIEAMLADVEENRAERERQDAITRAERKKRRTAGRKKEARGEAPGDEETKVARAAVSDAKKALEDAGRAAGQGRKGLEDAVKKAEQLHLIYAQLAQLVTPLRSKIESHDYKVDGMKMLLSNHKDQYGENSMYKMLRTEIHEEGHKVNNEREELRGLLPKEASKKSQLASAVATVAWEDRRHAKAQDKVAEAEAELEEKVELLKQELVLAKERKVAEAQRRVEEERVAHRAAMQAQLDADGRGGHPGGVGLARKAQERANIATPPMGEYVPEEEEEDNAGAFSTSETWIRRYAMAARAKSPRWRQSLLDSLSVMRAETTVKATPARTFTFNDTGKVVAPTYFTAKIKLPNALSEKFKMFCEWPPNPPFEPCTKYEVQLETREFETVVVTFSEEPANLFRMFILRFKSDCLTDQDVTLGHGNLIDIRATNILEVPTFQSLQERWAASMLNHDAAADQETAGAAGPRPEELAAYAMSMIPKDESYLQRKYATSLKAERDEVVKIPVFTSAPLALQDKIVDKTTVLQFPVGTKIVDQGSMGDAMYYVSSGSLIEKRVIGKDAVPVGIIPEGRCFGERCLIEPHAYESTYETLEASRVLRIKRSDLHALLPLFPGFFGTLLKLSYRRRAEYDTELSRRANGKMSPRGLPFRANQFGGKAYFERSFDLRARDPWVDQGYAVEKGDGGTLEKMRARTRSPSGGARGQEVGSRHPDEKALEKAALSAKLRGGVDKWESAALPLSTFSIEAVEQVDGRGSDWWKDRDPEQRPSQISLAQTSAELLRAVEARASAQAWRTTQLRWQGKFAVESIN